MVRARRAGTSALRLSGLVLLIASLVACGGASAPSAPSSSGTATRIIALAGNLAFGDVIVGQQSAPQTLTISNQGNSPLAVSGMTLLGGFVYGFSGGAIAPGESLTVPITFAPPAARSYNGVLTVSGDQTGGVNTIAVSGAGLAADLRLASEQGNFTCDKGAVCVFSASIQNVGTSCASDTVVAVRFFGDGGVQLGSDVPMDASGSLSSRTVRIQEVVPVLSQAPIGVDIATNAKTYRLVPTWTNVTCP